MWCVIPAVVIVVAVTIVVVVKMILKCVKEKADNMELMDTLGRIPKILKAIRADE